MYVTGSVLVSAYDIKFHKVTQRKLRFADLLFIDSGGYEISEDLDLSDQRTKNVAATPRSKWLAKHHLSILKNLDFSKNVVLVSYDNPRRRESLEKQIARARTLFAKFPKATSEILLKAEPCRSNRQSEN